MFALPLNVAFHGLVAGGVGACVAREVMAFPLIWYVRPLLRMIVLILPFGPFEPFFTLNPKLFFVPGPPG